MTNSPDDIPEETDGRGTSPPGDPRKSADASCSSSSAASSTKREKGNSTDASVLRPTELRSVSSGAFRMAGVKYKSAEESITTNENEGLSSPFGGFGRAIRNALRLPGRRSHESGTRRANEVKKDDDRTGLFSLNSFGSAPDEKRRVSNLLWDIPLRRWSSGDRLDGEEAASDWKVPKKTSIAQRPEIPKNVSLYNRGALATVVEAAEAKENAKARREKIRALCSARCCIALAALLAVAVGVTVGMLVLLRRRAPSSSGVDELEKKCKEDKVREWKGYRACHDLCEQAYCCFLPDWNVEHSCAEARKDWCTPYIKHCAILELIDSNNTALDDSQKNAGSGEDNGQQHLE